MGKVIVFVSTTAAWHDSSTNKFSNTATFYNTTADTSRQ
jgi:hypothetical protein